MQELKTVEGSHLTDVWFMVQLGGTVYPAENAL